MSKPVTNSLPPPAFDDPKHQIRLYHGDCLELLAQIPESSVDLVFGDPPYFLSNCGITCHAGKMVSVHKGDWDKSRGADANHEFNFAWLAACQRVLKPNGSIWVSGTAHVIHSVGFAMQQLGFKLLNDITWVKPNPPPNLSCRYFTHATETLIWAAKNKKSRHTFHYKHMKEINRGKQMKSVWEIRPPEAWEKKYGKHPTQKPVALLERMQRAISRDETPNLFLLHYELPQLTVQNVLLIPHFVFSLSLLEKRKPLSATARRAGWVGCNFLLDRIPPDAKIPVVDAGKAVSPAIVRKAYKKIRPLEKLNIEKRGWTLDVLNVVRSLKKNEFALAEVYDHADRLTELHPQNHHINDKIRQQLQVLRDLNLLEFLGSGSYRLT